MMIGQSHPFKAMHERLLRFATCDAPVLIEGETGTGKELAARELHYAGRRSAHAFVPVNCGALTDSLIESELFGYRRGAFTDARSDHDGLVTHAHEGTLFLDEIDTLSSKGQVALLRFLQDAQFRPVGGGALRSANVRVVCATNATLDDLVAQGHFRRDLLYRLNALHVILPPLRERGGDIILLANYFLVGAARQLGIAPKTWTQDALDLLVRYAWPGNLRELENTVLRSCLCSTSDRIEATHLTEAQPQLDSFDSNKSLADRVGFGEAKHRAVHAFERAYLIRLMHQSGGNVSRAAELSSTERRQFGKLLKKHGIERAQFKL
jgi:DNA-binding NtrC family response regulator